MFLCYTVFHYVSVLHCVSLCSLCFNLFHCVTVYFYMFPVFHFLVGSVFLNVSQ